MSITYEYSFTAFDDIPNRTENSSKETLLDLNDEFKHAGIDLVHTNLIKHSIVDAPKINRNIILSLIERSQTYPDRKQVLIHLVENPYNSSYQIVEGAINQSLINNDCRGIVEHTEAVNRNLPIDHILKTHLVGYLRLTYKNLIEIGERGLSNYLYYSSLQDSQNFGVYPLLVFLPSRNEVSIKENTDLLIQLCVSINELV